VRPRRNGVGAGEVEEQPRLLLTLARESELDDAALGPVLEDEGTINEQLERAIQQRVRSLLYEIRDRPTLLLVNSGNLAKRGRLSPMGTWSRTHCNSARTDASGSESTVRIFG
jgi:hypothetical protein